MTGKVAIIGAGIIGITNGIQLLEEGFSVTVFSKDDPLKTNSDAAVATWYAPDDSKPVLQQVCLESVAKFNELSKIANSGVDFIPIVHYYKDDEDFKKSIWSQKKLMELIKTEDVTDQLPKGAPKNSDFKKAVLTYTPLADVNVYRPYLLKEFEKLKGQLKIEQIKSLKELTEDFDIIINCSGWEAKYLTEDDKVYPVRGQTEIVSLPEHLTHNLSLNIKDLNSYVVFRSQSKDCVIGTTYQEKDADDKMRAEDKEHIIKKIAPFFPEIVSLKTTSKVGIRCGRNDVRIEHECMNDAHIFHCYGHGGSGFSGSWGSAQKVLSCIQDLGLHQSFKFS